METYTSYSRRLANARQVLDKCEVFELQHVMEITFPGIKALCVAILLLPL